MLSPTILLPMAIAASAVCSTLAGCASAVDSQTAMALPKSLSPIFPRQSVDHVITYAFWRGWGPRDGDRAVVTRHGDLVRLETRLIATLRREEAEVETSFSNLASGSSMSVVLDAEGVLTSMTLWQGISREAQLPHDLHRLIQTQDVEEIIGERCSVWRAEPEGEGVTYSACITSDGVMLRDTALSRNGGVLSERRAIALERRPVAVVEVLPPRAALDWAYWAIEPSDMAEENYAVTLTMQDERTGGQSRSFKADGILKSEERRSEGAMTFFTATGSNVTLSYGGGSQPRMSITSRSDGSTRLGPADHLHSQSAPMTDRPPDHALGEQCNWIDAAVGWDDYGRVECRTADGLPLFIEEHSRGSSSRWQVVSLSRGATRAGGARPPADLLSWSRWGWPMLDGE